MRVARAGNRATVERYTKAFFLSNDLDAIESTLDPDVEVVFPQSCERFRGRRNVRSYLEQYPGRDREFDASVDRVVGDDPSWLMSPAYTVLPIEGSGEQFTTVGQVRHLKGGPLHVIQLVVVRDGLIREINAYFAEPFDAPDWRAAFREPLAR